VLLLGIRASNLLYPVTCCNYHVCIVWNLAIFLPCRSRGGPFLVPACFHFWCYALHYHAFRKRSSLTLSAIFGMDQVKDALSLARNADVESRGRLQHFAIVSVSGIKLPDIPICPQKTHASYPFRPSSRHKPLYYNFINQFSPVGMVAALLILPTLMSQRTWRFWSVINPVSLGNCATEEIKTRKSILPQAQCLNRSIPGRWPYAKQCLQCPFFYLSFLFLLIPSYAFPGIILGYPFCSWSRFCLFYPILRVRKG